MLSALSDLKATGVEVAALTKSQQNYTEKAAKDTPV